MKTIAYDEIKLDNSVVCLGKFQGLHRGHMLLIKKTLGLAEEENINSVIFTINMNNIKRIYTDSEREEILSDMGFSYNVTCEFSEEFAKLTPRQFVEEILVKKLGVRYVVVGTDFRFGCERKGDVDLLAVLGQEYGFRVIAINKLSVDGTVVSSSYIRELIEDGVMHTVKDYMGRPYSITGIVSKGKQLGRQIGFPTVNLYPDEQKLIPLHGVYASHIYIDGVKYQGITNIGSNPTVNDSDKIFVETHILDFKEDLYDKKITVFLDFFVRPEAKFNNIDELKKQISCDKEFVMHQ